MESYKKHTILLSREFDGVDSAILSKNAMTIENPLCKNVVLVERPDSSLQQLRYVERPFGVRAILRWSRLEKHDLEADFGDISAIH